ncbi:hypothetical protein SGL43_02170 [Streptomyces globisporus]|uniref:Uncharacterized protein n=1 Tax=Streptomyces globisporus TaxID=1908 RepID=A0ABN8V357_STRGL|nr:hypothetical protein SGL43_02170 [Streptomyces globisporus]
MTVPLPRPGRTTPLAVPAYSGMGTADRRSAGVVRTGCGNP